MTIPAVGRRPPVRRRAHERAPAVEVVRAADAAKDDAQREEQRDPALPRRPEAPAEEGERRTVESHVVVWQPPLGRREGGAQREGAHARRARALDHLKRRRVGALARRDRRGAGARPRIKVAEQLVGHVARVVCPGTRVGVVLGAINVVLAVRTEKFWPHEQAPLQQTPPWQSPSPRSLM